MRISKAQAALASMTLGLGLLASMPATAQATRTWISGVGDDANPCSRTAPCRTFAGAYPKTAAGGEINCLDPGSFGDLIIEKSISVICDRTHAGTGYIVISAPNGAVTLSGLTLDGATLINPYEGILVIDAASVLIRRSTIRNFPHGGINYSPYRRSRLTLDQVTISGNALVNPNEWTGGLVLNPATGSDPSGVNSVGVIDANIVNSNITGNRNAGLRIVAPNAPGSATRVMIRRTSITGTTGPGIVVTNARYGNGPGAFTLVDSLVSGNSAAGIRVETPNASLVTARAARTAITGNAIGIELVNQGRMYSYGDNTVTDNGVNGAFTGLIPKR